MFVKLITSRQITTSMEQSPFWEVSSRSAGQEFLRLSVNPKRNFRVHMIQPLVTVNTILVTPPPPPPRFIFVLFFHLHLVPPSDRTPSGFQTKILYAFFSPTWVLRVLPISFSSSSIINRLKPKLVEIIFKISVRTAKKTPHFNITKINLLMLF
jgi:hypothetical protein